MSKGRRQMRGFTLIASMLLLVLLSSIAIGLMYLTSGAGHAGNNDLESNVAYYGAESGMEKLTTDLLSLYQQKLSPTQNDLNNLTNTSAPSNAMISNMTFLESATWTNPAPGGTLPVANTSVIGNGPYSGLTAEMIPITLHVSAIRPSGAAVNMTRGVQIALIPVFQFGVFSDSDLSYFAGPPFNFKGRVHTNGNLFLAADSGPLVLNAQVTAHLEIIRDRLANNFTNGGNYQGNVYMPTQTGGCDTYNGSGTAPAQCQVLAVDHGSWAGGIPPAGAANTANWAQAESNFPLMKNGTPSLTLPFVSGSALSSSAGQIQIIKEPVAGELASTPLGASREFNKANIRILLADTQVGLHPSGSPLDAVNDINLATYPGIATATTGLAPGWGAPPTGEPNPWKLVQGWLRVEYLDAGGAWNGVTQQWLNQGFARNPDGTPNTVSPNAILVLQKQTAPASGLWYPINFFDAREAMPRDTQVYGAGSTQCNVNGIMNALELDVTNLKRWITGAIPGSGNLVDPSPQNGYLVYFGDRRDQIVIAPKAGEFAFEDTINWGDPNGMPDGHLDNSIVPSPEDVDQDNVFDNKGAWDVGRGFGQNTTDYNPYKPVNCSTVGVANRVTGPRHALKLVNGSLGNLPMPGFTVAAENPVYVVGDYNSNSADSVWLLPPADQAHSAAAIIADAVTLLSVNWTDAESMSFPNNLGARAPARTNYRMAIAGGKNINFPQPMNGGNDLGTDGGVHNFLRYLEDWSPGGVEVPLYYRGSLVSLYYSQYATGIFKCCSMVYNPPQRNYSFDDDFLTPSNLPPGTPMLQDIENLTYWQNFSPCTSQSGGNCTN